MNYKARISFSRPLRTWDGFGATYIETAHTYNYHNAPQDYSGFSILNPEDRKRIMALLFGENGLQLSLTKMFLDPLQWNGPDSKIDHRSTTQWLRYFASQALKLVRTRGEELKIHTTLYGPPSWMTKQQHSRGRDLNMDHAQNLTEYIADWCRFLEKEEGLPVYSAGLHNEGDGLWRWNNEGYTKEGDIARDYNYFITPEDAAALIPLLRRSLDKMDLDHVMVTPGETSTWYWFDKFGYADEIAANKEAMDALGLITSHGFFRPVKGYWYSDLRSSGIDKIRSSKPDIPAWTTSSSWGKMDVQFAMEIYQHIYSAGINGYIPWAIVQNHSQWPGGDPNPGCGIQVFDDGSFELRPGYFWYKQYTLAGAPGTKVCSTWCNHPELFITAFGPDNSSSSGQRAFVVVNTSDSPITADLFIDEEGKYNSFVTRQGPDGDKVELLEACTSMGNYALSSGAPVTFAPLSATTFIQRN